MNTPTMNTEDIQDNPSQDDPMSLSGTGRQWLCDALGREMMNGTRSPERMQLAAALLSAQRLLLLPQACRAADNLSGHRASTIPWQRIAMPPVTWMEYHPADRPALSGVLQPRLAGILLLRDPNDHDALLVTGGWKGHHHERLDEMGLWGAVGRWSLEALQSTREPWSDEQACERLIGMGAFWLLGEPSTTAAGADSLWRLSVEATFAFSVLALLTTDSYLLEDVEDDEPRETESMTMDMEPERGIMNAVGRRANPRGGIWLPPLGTPIWTAPVKGWPEAIPVHQSAGTTSIAIPDGSANGA